MSEAINNVKQAFDAELAQTDLTNQEAVNNLRVKYLGKKGAVTDLMKQMGSLSAEERPAYGKLVNELKIFVVIIGRISAALMRVSSKDSVAQGITLTGHFPACINKGV